MKLPKLSRLLAQDYPSQAKWIEQLLSPINAYFEFLNQALSKNLTITDNMLGTIKTVELDGTWPIKVAWELPQRPLTVLVGNVYRSDGTSMLQVLTTTGDTNTSTSLTSLASVAGVRVGHLVTGTGIPTDTQVVGVSATGVTLSKAATATATGVSITFSLDTALSAVQVRWQYNQSGQLQIDGVTGVTPSSTAKYKVVLECKAG